jgi:uncharacterized damage-inducible protein DinB
MTDPGQHFIDTSRRYLADDYLPKIRRCFENLSEDDVWWRPNERSNSAGNLVLHLAGNVRQWIVSGVGGRPDTRERDQEFSADEASHGEEWDRERLLAHLEATLAQVDDVLAGISPAGLDERKVIQGNDVTVLEAVYHVVEHFSMHTGQIIWITKQRADVDLRFWDVRDGVAKKNW